MNKLFIKLGISALVPRHRLGGVKIRSLLTSDLVFSTMAATSTPMTLDGFVVETFDDKGQDEQSQNAPTNSVLEPTPTMPMAMPEPHAAGIGGFRIPDDSPVAVVDQPVYVMPVPAFPNGPTESTQGQGIVQEETKQSKEEDKSRKSSSDSSSDKEKHEKKHKHKRHHHHTKETSDISYELKHDEVISSEKILSRDRKCSHYF